MKNKLILHIPHSSLNIPIREGYVVDNESLDKEMLMLTDWYTDDLFYSDDDEMIVADFSRIFCDPERFADDSQEVMAKYGMGVLYEKSDAGEIMRQVSAGLRERILTEYYWTHHKRLSEAVNNQLEQFGTALILDCHSFPGTPLNRDLDKSPSRPDFNLGTDSFHTPKHLIEASIAFFEKAGYTLGIDWPYQGSLVPLEHYNKNSNVHSIMLEVNRTLYLKEPTNEKSEKYSEIKQVTGDFITAIKNIA